MTGRRGLIALLLAATLQAAGAQPEWKREFEDVCSRTQDAMALPLPDLRALIERCDKLQPQIDALQESERKVYSRRLKACRDLYVFVLQSRETEASP